MPLPKVHNGFAVAGPHGLLVDTVCSSEIGAKVNWLVRNGVFVQNGAPDERVHALWDWAMGQVDDGFRITPVEIVDRGLQ